MTKKYNKLVRDKIPEIIRKRGDTPVTHVAGEKEYWQKLLEKLGEEVAEFAKDSNIEEFADILEVLDAVAEHKGFDKKTVQEVQRKKADERGGFKKRIILDEA